MKLPPDRLKASRVPAQSWDSIEHFYSDMAEVHGWPRSMQDLVEHIRSSGLAQRLYAFTSHVELIIGLYPELDRWAETLHVNYDSLNETWLIDYYSQPTLKPEVSRSYQKDQGIAKFMDFIGYLKW